MYFCYLSGQTADELVIFRQTDTDGGEKGNGESSLLAYICGILRVLSINLVGADGN